MCHRYNVHVRPEQLAEIFAAVRNDCPIDFKTDLYPLSLGPIIRLDDSGERELVPLQWGLLPAWWKPSAKSKSRQAYQRHCFNARSETAHEKPSYRAAFRYRRCLVPVLKFNEKDHWFSRPDDQIFAFAGLWEHWTDGTEIVESYTLLTTEPNREVQAVGHPRMPVILDHEEDCQRWLSSDLTEPLAVQALLTPYQNPLKATPLETK